MIYAIEQINNSSLLPNVKIGYEIYDTCADVSKALKATLKLMSAYIHDDLGYDSNVTAVVGEQASQVSVAVAGLLTLPLMTQISFASTSESLSSRYKFPSFFRTVPSDKYQTEVIVQLVSRLNFAPVGIIGSEDEYGLYGAESLNEYFNQYNICVEFKEILPADFLSNNNFQEDLKKKLNLWKSEAIVVFTQSSYVEVILKTTIALGINRTWIASDAWATSRELLSLVNLKLSGRILGITCKSNKVPGFVEYMNQFVNQNSTGASFFQKLLLKYPFCPNEEQDCASFASNPINQSCVIKKCLMDFIEKYESYETYTVYMAVNIIAQALKILLQNTNSTRFPAWMLTEKIKYVNFSIDNTTYISLNEDGELNIGYDILEWKFENIRNISTIGEFGQNGLQLVAGVNPENYSKMVTQFNCYKSCLQGYELTSADIQCCQTCKPCAKNETSSGGRSRCHLTTSTNFLEWTNGFSIALAAFASTGLLVTLVCTVLFITHCHTPIARAAGGYLCFPALLSLLGCFISIFFFLGEPTDISCMSGLPLFGLSFTTCVSCILANQLRIFVGFTFKLKLAHWLKRVNKPLVIMIAFASAQVAVCVYWLVMRPPHRNIQDNIIGCEKGSTALFAAMLSYNALLCIICFLFSYMGRRLPELYKNGSFITVSMLIHLVVWIIFIPIYIQEYEIYERVIEASSILVSSYGILGCHFAPKCYIMIWKKELNNENKIVEHIQDHYRKKGITFEQ
ncbi:G-protein coupled receptor family C group 6 member A-like isoform X2 [Brachyhypopomus gauderio]